MAPSRLFIMDEYDDVEAVEEAPLDPKWYGVPPAGERKVPSRTRYILEITAVLAVEFLLWGIYRAVTADFYAGFGTYWFYIGHIIAAPTIHLGPILIYWKFFRKERLWVKTDRDENGHMSIDFGPFKMTRKLLLSAVLVGLFGGIVWRVTEMVVYSGASTVMGGSYMGSLTLFNLFSGGDVGVFFLMTFVMFFIVGPVEEFEFRSFVHDQSARVLPLWAALTFSSIFFGLSHIPIAITVYKLTPMELLFAEISWMTAGAVFGALYMWSRNIFAVIVMHGIGNWQLSVFLWQAKTKGDGLSDSQMMIASFVVSMVANALLIVLFYLINRWYWEPQRRGEPLFGGKLMAIQKFMHSHDNARRPVYSTSAILTLTTVFVLAILVGAATTAGTQEFQLLDPEMSPLEDDGADLGSMVDMTSTLSETGSLLEGETYSIPITSEEGQLLKGVSATLTWTDEPDIRRIRVYENTPDTFSLAISGPNATQEVIGANPDGAEGSITNALEFSPDEIEGMISTSGENYTISIDIKMVDAGMYLPRAGVGAIGLTDTGNAWSCTIELIWLTPPGSGNQTA
ncbi:MAG: CPBP family intramembrane metalloprotease [Thermoplasmata archaeon]|nr:CPBP family intramembrane metalloprotease [Thermoplasmata archaeon]